MSGIQTARGQEKFITPLKGYTQDESSDLMEYVTGQNVGGKKRALDTVLTGLTSLSILNVVEAGSTQRIIKKTGHGARKNDVIQFTSGANDGVAIQILSCPDANLMIIASTPDDTVLVGDKFDIKRYVTPQYDADGSLNVVAQNGPTQFVLDGVNTEVKEDTADPANNKPLPSKMFIEVDGIVYAVRKNTVDPSQTVSVPVEITGASGPINITAGDINVQLSDTGANPDITRIGNGTNRLDINANKEALTHDTDALAKLTTIDVDTSALAAAITTEGGVQPANVLVVGGHDGAGNSKHFLTDATGRLSVNVNSSALQTGGATAANQSTQITAIGSLLTELERKADLTETQPVSATSLPLPAGASTETTLSTLNGKVPANLTVTSTRLLVDGSGVTQPVSISSTILVKEAVKTNSYDEKLTLTTVDTFIAPANAIGGKIMASDENTDNVIYKQNGVATITSGMQLQPARSEDFIGSQSISVVSKSGTQAVMIQWVIQV